MTGRAVAACGTRAGYMRHKRRGEEPCEPCAEANRAYFRAWRRTHPDVYKRRHSQGAARGRALTRLAQEQPGRYRALYGEELRRQRREGEGDGRAGDR